MDLEKASKNAWVAAFLTLSGGFLDAFTYVGHGHVFANTMTGNVALLGVNLATGQWAQAVKHIPPLLAFVCAIVVVHLLSLRRMARCTRYLPIGCLVTETLFLAVVASGLFALPELWLISGVSFVATLQTLSFTHLENLTYTSVMTTGNLRRAVKRLLDGLSAWRDPLAMRDSKLLGMVSACFFIGALGGAYLTHNMHDQALWGAVLLLLAALIRIIHLLRRGAPACDVPPDKDHAAA
jgi:uncharacterized membrane protein YoaK (UPF0700 family)